jgi:hypothetical protein
MNSDYRPRFSFDITEEQQRRANELIATHGQRKAMFQVILDDVLDLLEEHGQIIYGIIVDGQAKPREILPTMSKAERKAK